MLPTFSIPAAVIIVIDAVVANSRKVCIISLCSPIVPEFKLTTEANVIENLTGQLPTRSLAKCANFNAPDFPLIDFKG